MEHKDTNRIDTKFFQGIKAEISAIKIITNARLIEKGYDYIFKG